MLRKAPSAQLGAGMRRVARMAKLKGKKNLKMAPFQPQLEVSKNCAFLLFKDRKTVLFYTSALNGIMPCDVIYSTEPIAKKFVYGLCPLKQWTDDSMGMRNTLMAPSTCCGVQSPHVSCRQGGSRLRYVPSTKERTSRNYGVLYLLYGFIPLHCMGNSTKA